MNKSEINQPDRDIERGWIALVDGELSIDESPRSWPLSTMSRAAGSDARWRFWNLKRWPRSWASFVSDCR